MKPAHLFSLVLISALFLPALSFAQVTDVFGLTNWAYTLLVRLGTLFWALAIALFIWGVVKFIGNANETAEHAKGKQFILWGIIALVVITSLWGIVWIVLSGTFGITPGGSINYIYD